MVGLYQFLHGDTASATEALHRAADAAEKADDPTALGQAAAAAMFIGDDSRALTLFARAARARVPTVRSTGSPWCWRRWHRCRRGAADTPRRRRTPPRASNWRRDTGQENPAAHLRSVLAWVAAVQGREQECRDAAAAALERAIGHRLGPQAAIASWALAVLDLGMGRPG